MKNVMVRAWEIARVAVAKFGGSAREFFAQALVMAWTESRKLQSAKEVYKEKKAQAKAMSQSDWDALINKKIVMVKSEMKRHLMYYGSAYDWVKRELNDLVSEGIRDMRKERFVSVEEAAYMVIDKRF